MDRELKIPQYDIELWEWKTNTNGNIGTYVADISNIITDGISIQWKLNDVESLDFSIDLIQFENRCRAMGQDPQEVLTPYVHDVRVRRNGEYILGCQIVEANINISNNTNATIQIRCTGFLNLFKDRYITYPFRSNNSQSPAYYNDQSTPALTAQRMINLTQAYPSPEGLIKNPTGDIDRDGWFATNGVIDTSYAFRPHNGSGHIRVTNPSNNWLTCGTRLYIPQDSVVQVGLWAYSSTAGQRLYLAQRQYINDSTNENQGIGLINGGYVPYYAPNSNVGAPLNTTYSYYSFQFTAAYDNPYLVLQTYGAPSYGEMGIDDVFASYVSEANARSFNVTSGYVDTSTLPLKLSQNYQMQNIKDALIELSEIDDNPIEFKFGADRKYYIGYKDYIGDTKPDIILTYPGNIESMTIARSASSLANSVLTIGSGIGDERVQAIALDQASMNSYGLRESVSTNNNASEYLSIAQQAQGRLRDVKDPSNLPKVVVRDGSINPGNVQIGDRIYITVNNNDPYLNTINNLYRIMQYDLNVDLENVETVTLTVEPV